MAMQIRRGTNAERQLMIPLQGELIFTTDTKKLYVGDGITLGGVIVDTAGSGGEPDGNTTYTISAETVSGGADIRLAGSDLSVDNVKLAAGANITVTRTDPSTITIASTGTGGGASALVDLTDVVITGSPTNGQVLKYDGTNWVNGTDSTGTGGGAADLNDLTDVSLSIEDLAEGQVLKYNGTNWVNLPENLVSISIDELTDVALNTGTLAEGQVLKYDGAVWYNADDVTTPVSSLDDIGNVAIDSLTITPGQVLSYDGTNWVNESLSTTALNDITDVTITGTLVDGQVLKYNGTNWVNQSEDPVSISIDELTDVALNTGTLAEGQVLKYDGAVWYNAVDENTAPLSLLDDFEDVSIDALTLEPGQVLKWNGASWTNQEDSFGEVGGAETLDELADVAIDYPNLTLGQLLSFDGTQWVNANPIEPDPYAIDDLTDVEIILTPTTGQVLGYDGSKWVNKSISVDEVSEILIDPLTRSFGQTLVWNNTDWVNGTQDILDLSGVDIDPVSLAISDFLVYNGTNWTNAPLDISTDTNPSLGGDLDLNGSNIIGTGNIEISGAITFDGAGTSFPGEAIFNNEGLQIFGLNGIRLTTEFGGGISEMLNISTHHNSIRASSAIFTRSKGTSASPTSLVSGDEVFALNYYGYGTADYGWTGRIVMGSDPAQAIGTNYIPGRASIVLADSAGVLRNRFNVDSSGVVGVTGPTLVSGSSSGQVNIGSVQGYLKMVIGGVERAIPFYAINP